MTWSLPPADWAARLTSDACQSAEVHVWAASLEVSADAVLKLKQLLSPDEQVRAGRFHFDLHRHRFIAGRALLRQVLGGYLAAQPSTVTLVYSANGKPSLTDGAIQFNLSHSQDLALLAVSTTGPIGVDVEHLRPIPDAADLVDRFFSRRESAAFNQLLPLDQPTAFYNLWTRKEALLKATGEGIGRFLNQVEVGFLANEPAEFRSLPPQFGSSAEWQLYSLAPAQGYIGALAVAARPVKVSCWRWSWEGSESRRTRFS